MAAVRCGIDNKIRCCRINTAFKDSFKRCIITVVLGKRKIVDEYDEFQRIFAYSFNDIWYLMQLFLFQFDESQTFTGKLIRYRLYGRRFTCTSVTVEQHIVCGLACKQCFGVQYYLFTLLFIIVQLRKSDRIRVFHRGHQTFFYYKYIVL